MFGGYRNKNHEVKNSNVTPRVRHANVFVLSSSVKLFFCSVCRLFLLTTMDENNVLNSRCLITISKRQLSCVCSFKLNAVRKVVR